MKKFLLAAALLAIGANANAQELRSNVNAHLETPQTSKKAATKHAVSNFANKGTGLSNPFHLMTDSMTAGVSRLIYADYALPADSGYIYGTSVYGDNGFAYLYDLNFDASGNNDTTITVLGFISKWGGKIQPTSTKTVSFNVWSRGVDKTLLAGHSRFYIYGKPATSLASVTVKDTTLKTDGNFTITPLSTSLGNQSSSVYVGVTIGYTWNALAADTFGLRSTGTSTGTFGATQPNYYTIVSGDTLLDVNNMVQSSGGAWKSPIYEKNMGGLGDMIIAPIVSLNCATCAPTAINGVSRNSLTFFGTYPNPAINSTNVRFAIKNKADVTIQVIDAAGRTISTNNQSGLTVGEHTVSIATANLAAGNYICLLRTSEGDAIASQFSVIR